MFVGSLGTGDDFDVARKQLRGADYVFNILKIS